MENFESYARKIASLSEEDRKERDKYLRKMALGEILGPKTTLASLDKPWLQWYTEEQIDLAIPRNMSTYDYLLENTKNMGNIYLLEYYGRRYTRDDIIEEVENNIRRLKSMGLKAGDTVSFIMLNTPEIIFLWYALSKMGITANMIKFDESPERIKYMTELTNSKYLFATSVPFILENVDKALENNGCVEKVITIELTDSLSKNLQEQMLIDQAKMKATIDCKKNNRELTKEDIEKEVQKQLEDLVNFKVINDNIISNDPKYITFDEWKKNMADDADLEPIENIGDYTSVIVYTGGTTGEPKGVMLSNDNLNIVSHNFGLDGFGLDLGEKGLNILPPAVSYYFCGTHFCMSSGMDVSLIYNFEIEEYPYLIEKIKPNLFMSGPILLENMRKANILEDTSFIHSPISGGDKLLLEEEIADNEYFKSHGGNAKVRQGYGMSESASAVSFDKLDSVELGSVGIVFLNVNVGVFEYDDSFSHNYQMNELPINTVGEICITGPQLMKGYFDDLEATNKLIRRHKDGLLWLHTDDLGYISENGNIFHKGRAKRMLTRSGVKVWIAEIEDAITKNPLVLKCSCVKKSDEDEREVPVAHIVLNDGCDYNLLVNELIDYIKNNVNIKSVPKYFVFRDELPYSETNRKVNVKMLEQENILDETNEIFGNIIIKNDGLKLKRSK